MKWNPDEHEMSTGATLAVFDSLVKMTICKVKTHLTNFTFKNSSNHEFLLKPKVWYEGKPYEEV